MPSGSAHEIAMLKVGERIAAALETIAKAWTEDNALKRQYAASLVRQPRTGALVSEEDEPVKPPPIGTPKPSMPKAPAAKDDGPSSDPLGVGEDFVPGTRDASWRQP